MVFAGVLRFTGLFSSLSIINPTGSFPQKNPLKRSLTGGLEKRNYQPIECLINDMLCFGFQPCLADWGLRGPPKTETTAKLSSSYIPAAMQIIAHDTELMKYVIKPPERK